MIQAVVDAALEQRKGGNTLFAAGDLPGALREWHSVVFRLKGKLHPSFLLCVG